MTIALVHFNHSARGSVTTWPDVRTSLWSSNYGDVLVCAAIVRQLDAAKGVRLIFRGTLKAPVDRAIIRGSTYLHRDFDYAGANITIDSIDAPVAIVGLGAQNPTLDPHFLDNHRGARDFIARLNEKSKSISVRGAFTADIVERLGGKNIRITGCPSLFYDLKCPSIRVPEMLRLPQRSIGISIHSILTDNIFCHAPEAALRKQGEAIAWGMGNAASVAIFEQGNLVELDAADRGLSFEARRAAAQAITGRIGDGLFSPEDLMARMVSIRNIEEWLARVRDLDAMIGVRFHGNMMALLQGKPCYYYTYDSRLKEFNEIYGLPSQDVTESWTDPAEAMLRHDWADTNSRISRLFGELKEFYAENGFTSTFPEETPAPQPA